VPVFTVEIERHSAMVQLMIQLVVQRY